MSEFLLFVRNYSALKNFSGQAERIFALVSDSRVSANSLFVDMSKKPIEATAIGSTCFRKCNDVAILHPNGTVLVNGKQKNLLGGTIRIAPQFEIRPFGRKAAEVLFGNWSVIMSFRYNHHFDMVKMTHTSPYASF